MVKNERIHMPVVAPSKIKDYKENEMMNTEILDVIKAFVKGIKRAKKCWICWRSSHVAHGYLLSEFVSPRMNRRDDEWGGNTENRFRIIKTIFKMLEKK